MKIIFCDSIPLDNGTFGYGVTACSREAYCAYCTDEEMLLMPINIDALNIMTKGVKHGTPFNCKAED